MDLSIITYDSTGAWRKSAASVEELLALYSPVERPENHGKISWINVDGFENPDAVNRIALAFNIHPLTVEDILDVEQRPKVEEFDNYLFILLKSVSPEPFKPSGEAAGAEPGMLDFEQISLILKENTVISFQEKTGDYFDGIRKRILNNGGRIRRMGADYLAYALMDAVVDEYFVILDTLGSNIEEFEDRAIDQSDKNFIRDLQKTKRDLLRTRRIIWPLRESLSTLMRMETAKLSGELEPFIKDLQGNVIQAAETVETYRELIAGLMEVNLSTVSNRMNGIMKVLTIISTIFIPLTFIVGVYGMNFEYMPELSSPLAYPIVWGLMVLIAVIMLVLFKIRRWL